MPIDTAEERKSIAGIHLYASGPGVTNNASPDGEWRQEVGYSYSGILVGGGGAGAADIQIQQLVSSYDQGHL